MIHVPSRFFDLLFYGGIGAIVYFVLPVVTDFVQSVSEIEEALISALKDVFLVWSAVWFCSKRNHH